MLRPRGGLILTVLACLKGDWRYACIDEHSFVIVENIGVVKCYIGNLSWDLCRVG
jgi:SRSO17 transposase